MKEIKHRFDELLEKAKEGDGPSQLKLAKWLAKGHLVEKDLEAAKYWAFKATMANVVGAGEFYETL